MTVGVLIAFMQYAQRFFRPIQDLSEKFNILQSAMAACERIFKLLDEPLPAPPAEAPLALTAPRGEIEFRNVWFAYHGGANPKEEDWVLRDVSFHIAPGQTLAIVGHTGAGKTTLIQLLLRFYEIQRGQILLDGVDIRRYDVHQLRRQFGIVLQDPFLFTGTLESNVRLGDEDISRARVESALREVGLGSLLDSLPEGVETNVSERGATFSVGQRQLISFARALGAQSAVPDSRRSDIERGHENRNADSRGARPSARGPHRARHRAPAQHHSACRPHSRFPQRQIARAGFAPATARPARHLLSPVPAPVQGPGAARVLRDGGKRSRHVRSRQRLAGHFASASLSGWALWIQRLQSRQAEALCYTMPPTQILISAGEASGDMYAARLAAALRARADVQLFGMGGPRMRDAGVELVADCSEVSLVGIVEIAKKYPALKRVWKRLLGEAARRKPRLAILTDFPGFHLRLARALKRQGVPERLFRVPAVLGLAAVAGEPGAPAIRSRAVHFPVRSRNGIARAA